MTLARRVLPIAMSVVTSARTRALRRAAASASRRLRGRARELHYFHQVDDPYSALAAQTLRAFSDRYDVALIPHLVAPPSDAAAPERALLEAFARHDAADVAPGYGLAFPANAPAPPPEAVALAQRVLARAISQATFLDLGARVSAALWNSDVSVLAAIADGTALRERLGHYLGSMFHYESEWVWGVDRLHHLERRLIGDGCGACRASECAAAARPTTRPGGRTASGG